MRELIKKVECQPLNESKLEIRLYDTGRTDRRGCTVIEVELDRIDLSTNERESIFAGSDMYMSPSPMHADDSDDSVRSAISMVSMRKGDTDSEWFDCYTSRQLEWCESYECESLQIYGLEPSDEESNAEWIDLELE